MEKATMELRISPGGRRFLAPTTTQAPASSLPDDPALRLVIDDLDRAGQTSSGRTFQQIQNEKNALYTDLIHGDHTAAEGIQLRILAQLELLNDKLAAGWSPSNPMSTALVPVQTTL